MEAIQNLTQYNWFVVVSAIIVAMLAFKFLSDLFEWFVKKFGIETKSMREKRENKELLKTTAENLAKLQDRHTEDEETFRKDLNIATGTMTKMRRNEEVALSVLLRICEYLDCNIGDICDAVKKD